MDAIEALAPGRFHRVAFVAVPGTTWTLPLYELALLTADRTVRENLDLAIELVTPESAPLGVFGAEASAGVARELTSAGIRVGTGTFAKELGEGKLWLQLEGAPRSRSRDRASTPARPRTAWGSVRRRRLRPGRSLRSCA